MTNRLGQALSPYLRQHADNPVDWFEWGPDAFAAARERDVPILLSVGYAACHWCHVMAHESFEDAGLAELINADFVAIKVDREERPDIDAVYMDVTQALTGRGGWPMTVFLTPHARPLFAGTYFPPAHFAQVLAAIADIWRTDRAKAESTATNIVHALQGARRRDLRGGGHQADAVDTSDFAKGRADGADDFGQLFAEGALDGVLARSVRQLRHQFDDAHGGFGGAPKFPPSMTLEQLLRHYARTGDDDALAMTVRTCEAMARGGMYDQLDGGFARYSVDADWVVPHFEKMLYDNAQLLRVYAHLARQLDEGHPSTALARRVANETADFLLRRLGTSEGVFASALDADTNGVEGLTYAWTTQELVEVLGESDGQRAARLLSVTDVGTFEHGMSTLQLRRDPGSVFASDDVDGRDPDQWWQGVRATLATAREKRPQPARDDKVVTSWNALAISGLVEAGMILERGDLVAAARTAANYLLGNHLIDGRLRRVSLAGQVGDAPGMADDYGNFAEALGLVYQATGEVEYLNVATSLLDTAASIFVDESGVYDTPADAETLFVRPQSSGDNAEPCGASSLASASVMLWALTSEPRFQALARRCVGHLTSVIESSPRFAGWALATLEAVADGPVQLAISVDQARAKAVDVDELQRVAWQAPRPGLVRVVGPPNAAGHPLLRDRAAGKRGVSAYVCRGFACDAPVFEAHALRSSLWR